jgi:hypothetical protein
LALDKGEVLEYFIFFLARLVKVSLNRVKSIIGIGNSYLLEPFVAVDKLAVEWDLIRANFLIN